MTLSPIDQVVHDGNGPDPEELETNTEEEVDIPLPEKVSHDFDATGNGPDDEELVKAWKNQERDTDEHVEIGEEPDDSEDKEDLSQGDEGIDDPSPRQR